jgi:hypothetical protein
MSTIETVGRTILITEAVMATVGSDDQAQLSMWLDEVVEEYDVHHAISEDGYNKLFEPKGEVMEVLTEAEVMEVQVDLERQARAHAYSDTSKADLVEMVLELEDKLANAQQAVVARVVESASAQQATRTNSQEKAAFFKYLGFVEMLSDAQKSWLKRQHAAIGTSPWDAIQYERNGKVVKLSWSNSAISNCPATCGWAYKVWQGLASEKDLKSYRNRGIFITMP